DKQTGNGLLVRRNGRAKNVLCRRDTERPFAIVGKPSRQLGPATEFLRESHADLPKRGVDAERIANPGALVRQLQETVQITPVFMAVGRRGLVWQRCPTQPAQQRDQTVGQRHVVWALPQLETQRPLMDV